MRNETPTGNIRFRVCRGGILCKDTIVLQVEMKYPAGPDDYHGMSSYLSGTYWRDARPDDVINNPKLIGHLL